MGFGFYLVLFILLGSDEARRLSHKKSNQALRLSNITNQKGDELKAGRLIEEILNYKTSIGTLKQAMSKHMDQYFSSDLPWGLTSLGTLLMHVSMHDRISGENVPILIKILFAALLPPGLDDIIIKLCSGFVKRYIKMDNSLKEKDLVKMSRTESDKPPQDDIEIMMLMYLFVHYNKSTPQRQISNSSDSLVAHEILSKASRSKVTPQKSTLELLRRFQKLYHRGTLMNKLF
jgi:hypothetical protein